MAELLAKTNLFVVAAVVLGLIPLRPNAYVFAQDRTQDSQASVMLSPVTVVSLAPMPGAPLAADKLPGEVETISVERLARDRRMDTLPALAASAMANVSINDEQGSPFQPDFVYRGFEASPVSGVAEGIAVYQDGVRLNESFGDNVNWDLVPQFAVQSFSLQSNNPVFGLNALGGAVTLKMKDGFNFQGLNGHIAYGSYNNLTGYVESGAKFGDFALYLGAGGTRDDGYRYHSAAALRQGYGDLAYDHGRLTLHLSMSGALNDIAAVGPTPIQMLVQNPKAVFTYPQSTHNEMALAQLRGDYRVSNTLSLSANAYVRQFRQNTVDGNTTDVTACANDSAQFCLEGASIYPGDALYDAHGNRVPTSVLPQGATPGEIDFTQTDTLSEGVSVQAASSAPLWRLGDTLVIGAALDHGATRYGAKGELGVLQDSLRLIGSGVSIDQSFSTTAQPPIEEPVSVHADNTYSGVYAIDVLDLTSKLSWTVSGRFNMARVQLNDLLGNILNARHSYRRFNPGSGLAYKITPSVTVYAGYSESNRTPTPGELSCANPSSPCLLAAFLVSDPNLKQVVSHTYEAGFRGSFKYRRLPGAFTWAVSLYRTDVDDDIQLLATAVNGFGFFHNAGATRRQGFDGRLAYRGAKLTLGMSYAFLDAVFLSNQAIASNSPSSDANGIIYVKSGDHLPLEPAHRITISADYAFTPNWSLGGDMRFQTSQYLVGDQSNQQAPLPGFTVVGLRSTYHLSPRFELFGEIQNLFDRRYYSYGAFTSLDGLPPSVNLTNPRTYSPSEGRTVSVGAHIQLF